MGGTGESTMAKKNAGTIRVNASKNAAALSLATKHFELEPGLIRIFRMVAKPGAADVETAPIILLEVNENTVPTGILPLYFGPDEITPFPVVIVEITPAEFGMVKSGELKLPKGWVKAEEFARPGKAIGAK
jgi:hypothetical protein